MTRLYVWWPRFMRKDTIKLHFRRPVFAQGLLGLRDIEGGFLTDVFDSERQVQFRERGVIPSCDPDYRTFYQLV